MKLLILIGLLFSFNLYAQENPSNQLMEISKDFISIRKDLRKYRIKSIQTGKIDGSFSGEIVGSVDGSMSLFLGFGGGKIKGNVKGYNKGELKGELNQILQENGEYYMLNCYANKQINSLRKNSTIESKIDQEYKSSIEKDSQNSRKYRNFRFKKVVTNNFDFNDEEYNCNENDYQKYAIIVEKIKSFRSKMDKLFLNQVNLTDKELKVFQSISQDSKNIYIISTFVTPKEKELNYFLYRKKSDKRNKLKTYHYIVDDPRMVTVLNKGFLY
jgi:hypothetical protein